MRQEDAFLQAVLDEPDDDAPRLIYADWLEERGDPRGEFIRVQCALARLPPDDPRRPELRAREQALLAEHRDAWLAPIRELADGDGKFHRGFVEQVTLDARAFLDRAEKLFARAPVQRLQLYGGENIGPALAGWRCLGRLNALNLRGCNLGPAGAKLL